MKKKYLTLLALITVVFVVAFVISCKRNNSEPFNEDEKVSATVLQALQAWQNSHTDQSIGKVSTQSTSKPHRILKPIWDTTRYKTLTSGERVITVSAPGYNISNKAYNFYRTFVYTQNNGTITGGNIVEFYSLAGGLKNIQDVLASYKQNAISGFSGEIVVYDINYNYLSSTVFENGKALNGTVYIHHQNQSVSTQVNSKLRIAATKLMDESNGGGNDGGGGSGTGTDDDGCVYTVLDIFIDGVWTERYILDESCPNQQPDSPPTNPSDPPPPGGDASAPPDPCAETESANGKIKINDNGCAVKTIDTLAKDPCAARTAIDAIATANAMQNSGILTDMQSEVNSGQPIVEWGSNIRIASENADAYIYDPIHTNKSTDPDSAAKWAPAFTWNATQGYTVGYTHGHIDDAPSPADVTVLINNIAQIWADGGTASDVAFYEAHASLTCVTTTNGTYMVKVNDWDALSTLASSSNNANLTSKYKTDRDDNSGSTEEALMEVFGNSITLYKDANNTNNFVPLTIDHESDNTFTVINRNCN